MNGNNAEILRLLSYWLRQRQDNEDDMEDSSELVVYDEDGQIVVEQAKNKLASDIKNHDLDNDIKLRTRANLPGLETFEFCSQRNTFNRVSQKEYKTTLTEGITSKMVPRGRRSRLIDKISYPYFVGQFSKDGFNYISASQDKKICVYDTSTWKIVNEIKAKDVGWTIVDVANSPDNRFIIYSSWNPNIFFCNIESHSQESLLITQSYDRICHFSLRFSPNSSEILAGSSNQCFYLYDINSKRTTYTVLAHDDDINAVEFVDESSNLILTGSDDSMIKVWDKRERSRREVGTFVGHLSGITHICSKEDGRYFITNSKDQSLKLWDIRKFVSTDSVRRLTNIRSNYDYRYGDQTWGRREKELFSGKYCHSDDCSVMTYRGHSVFNSLIRCYFSPSYTAQQYIYTGSSNGIPLVFDLITGEIVQDYKGHKDVVRDVSWNPNFPQLVTSSWDGSIRMWDV